MSEPKRQRLTRKRKLTTWSGRGEIYAWLRAHYGQIKKHKVGDDRPWAELLLDMRADLASSMPAERIALNNVLNTWKRVCRDLDDSAPENRFKNYPSRIPKDWRPSGYSDPDPVIAPRAASVPGTLMRAPPPRGPGMSIMEKLTGQPDVIRKEPAQRAERDVDAEIAGLRQQMRKRAVKLKLPRFRGVLTDLVQVGSVMAAS
jgi:hypothetical protein